MPAMADWQLTIDCHSPSRLVGFWAEVLGYEVMEPPSGFDTWNDWYLSVGVPADELDLDSDSADRVADPTGNGPSIWFQPVPEHAAKGEKHEDHYFVVMRDPEGNEFCVA